MDREGIARDFSVKVYKKFKDIIKSIVLFGSTAKEEAHQGSDIDIIIIVDDCSVVWDQELIVWYREELSKLLAEQKYKDRIHVNSVTLSTFWDEILKGDPVVINVIRYGKTLIDFGGFFDPLKILLEKGKIRPSAEAIYNALKRAPYHLSRSRYGLFLAIDGIYWAMVDAAHAALMMAKKTPPSPEHVAEMLETVFVENGLLERKYVEWYKEIYGVAHHLSRGNILDISGNKIQMYRDRADEFVGVMAGIVKEIERRL